MSIDKTSTTSQDHEVLNTEAAAAAVTAVDPACSCRSRVWPATSPSSGAS